MKVFKKGKWGALAGCFMAVAVIAALAGGSYSKYKQTLQMETSLTVASGALAQGFVLEESSVAQTADGMYTIGSNVVKENTYYVAKGVTVPKNPYVTVTGKSVVDAYLYVEIIEGSDVLEKTNTDEGLGYAVSDQWRKLDSTAGKHGGVVYVYTAGKNRAQTINNESSISTLAILANNQVTVGKSVNYSDDAEVSLTFYGYLGQAALGNSAEAVYQAIPADSQNPNQCMITEEVENTFEEATTSVEVKETFDGTTKSNVFVKNTGSTSNPVSPAVYVRVKLLAYWYEKDSDHIAGKAAWTPSFTLGTDWLQEGEYYYYKNPVNAGSQTSNLISSITLTTDADGNRQVLEILTESIQANPKNNLVDAGWPATVSGRLN